MSVEECGCHLGSASVVDARKHDIGHVGGFLWCDVEWRGGKENWILERMEGVDGMWSEIVAVMACSLYIL